jgi:CheY-like chemotaxis protein
METEIKPGMSRCKGKSMSMREPIRALIVDDQPRARKSLKALLSTWSPAAEIWEATNGQEALQRVRELQFDVVLMDVRMPGMDGLTATRLIKECRPQVKVVVLSMYAEHQDEALDAGADAFLGKGEAAERLLDLLSVMIWEGG